MRYGVGDKVKIRYDLAERGENGAFDGGPGYDEEMGKYAGMVMTIAEMFLNTYHMIEDHGNWWWSDDMLDLSYGDVYTPTEEKNVVHEAIEKIDRQNIIDEIYDTLNLCEIYHPTDKGINAVIDLWAEKKGREDVWNGNSVLDILSKHPDYVPEKGYIVKKNEYDRGIDFKVIDSVMKNICRATQLPIDCCTIKPIEIKPWSVSEIESYISKLSNIVDCMRIDKNNIRYRGMTIEEVKRELNEWTKKRNKIHEEYAVYYGLAYSKELKEKVEKAGNLFVKIRDWVTNVENSISEEDLQKPLLIDDSVVKYIEESELNIRGIRAGQKFNKVIVKILTEIGVKDTWDDYNKETARLGDAASPTKFTRFTIISANPLDYYRMSFGSSWSSCQTIDKEGYYRPSDGGDNYEGMHASGTSSYMGDQSTVVMYTVDKSYEGSDYEMQPKINRCLFHLGEGKFVMGRVYPQGTDGEEEVYRQWRQIFQQIIAECMDVPNYWKTVKDRDEKRNQIESSGTHYRDYDYEYCNIAGFSYIKPTADTKPSVKYIKIGSQPICPSCGCLHWEEDTIECPSCRSDEVECACCGYSSDRENMHYIDGEWYCEDCCFYCEYHNEWETGESYYVENYGYVCEYALENGDFRYCDNCGSYYWIDDCDGIETENGYWFCSTNCAERAGYAEAEDGLWYPEDELHECPECGALVTDSDWDEDLEMCTHCAENHEEQTA